MEKDNENPKPCDCEPFGSGDSLESCCGGDRPDPFSKEELKIFRQMTHLKKEAQTLKSRLAEIEEMETKGQELSAALVEEKMDGRLRLKDLQSDWARLKEEKEEEGRKRMVRLGHLSDDGKGL